MTAEPIPVRELRYRCPFCGRAAGRPGRVREHMARCWWNPENRGCKTCVHFDRGYDEYGDGCFKGVDLWGRPACKECGGHGSIIVGPDLGVSECGACGGDGAEVKPGPIIHCDQWQERPER